MSEARCRERIALTPKRARQYGIGAFKKGNILIVGERPARPHLGLNLPFAEMRGCSGWLNEQLEAANIDEKKLMWVNAYDCSGKPAEIMEVLMLYKPSHVLCLGRKAEFLCRIFTGPQLNFGPVVEYFQHPQSWKRFHSKKPYPLINRLIALGAVK